jgi:hypothetical protein
MAANAPLSQDANALPVGAHVRPRLLDRLNRTVDRLFGFELQPEELLDLAHPRKVVESRSVLDPRATLSG